MFKRLTANITNVFDKPNEQRPSLLGLCRGEKTCLEKEPYHDSCHKMVCRKYIYPVFGISYRTFLRYLKIRLPMD